MKLGKPVIGVTLAKIRRELGTVNKYPSVINAWLAKSVDKVVGVILSEGCLLELLYVIVSVVLRLIEHTSFQVILHWPVASVSN